MKKNSFTGKKSIPVDFSKMSICDLRLILEIVEDLVAKAKKTTNGALEESSAKKVSVPLKQLAKVFGIKYAVSIELVKINVAIREIKDNLEALSNLEEIFFSKLNEQFKASGKKGKATLKLVRSGGVYGSAAWEV